MGGKEMSECQIRFAMLTLLEDCVLLFKYFPYTFASSLGFSEKEKTKTDRKPKLLIPY